MRRRDEKLQARLLCGAAAAAILMAASPALAQETKFNITAQPLADGLNEFAKQSGRPVMFTLDVAGARVTRGVSDVSDPELALNTMLAGTGLSWRRSGETFLIVKADADPQGGSAAGGGAEVEALIVTAQKREEDIQDVPIAISAFSQEDLTRSQVAGGPDLMTQVPNMTFTKTNFSSYSVQIRGIGTQAISATTDAAVAIAFNNTPFIRNRFFEQEFYDLQRVEVLRGPQGTLYGRNATAGVVNIISAKPRFDYEARLSADVANYNSTRLEGMVNVPLVDDMVALRLAGAWTKREGFVTNQITGNPIDGRDLWSTRVSLRFTPTDWFDANLIWEHFEEDDDRLRSGKQLCHKDIVTEVDGIAIPYVFMGLASLQGNLSQGCNAASLYSPDSFQTPNGYALAYYQPLSLIGLPTVQGLDPYLSTTQSRDLRVIESTVDPHYRAETDVVELQVSIDLTDNLIFTSETGYLSDVVFSTQDFNRFNTAPGAFDQARWDAGNQRDGVLVNGVFCDPQVGCADRLVAVDLSTADSHHFSQEFRLGSSFDGPLNFSLGANFLRYDSEDKYYVFVNTLTFYAAKEVGLPSYIAGVSDNRECLTQGFVPPNYNKVYAVNACVYIDPNSIDNLNDQGHNYFLSRNPYKLISYAAFGEVYYNIADNLKITAGVRYTVDQKEAPRIPSWILAGGNFSYSAGGAGYSVVEVIEQEWREPTGRLTIDWKPDLSFTDETLLYASLARGYKAGGSNPPPAGVVLYEANLKVDVFDRLAAQSATKPKIFDPEFVNAFEIGSKNTILDGRMTVNTAAFYYDYTGYQISQIVDRSATNLNFDAKIWGLEIEADWRPLENLRFGFKGGYENTKVADGSQAVDLMDRTAGHDDWILVKPFPSLPSNCILPLSVINQGGVIDIPGQVEGGNISGCELAYTMGVDPITGLPYVPNPTVTDFGFHVYPGYEGFNPATAPNNGEGFYKDLSGNELPNAPRFTATITTDFTIPLPNEWLMTLHSDLYYQSEAWTRIFNTEGYDKLKAYTNVNLAAIFTNEEAGWKVMAYVKNVFDRDSITGAFLNSDDTGLTTNVFLTEPRLYGLRVTKEWNGGPWWTGANPDHPAGEPYPLTIELGGQVQRREGGFEHLAPDFIDQFSAAVTPAVAQDRDFDWGDGRDVRLIYQPAGSPWRVSASVRYGRANTEGTWVHQSEVAGPKVCAFRPNTALARQFCDPFHAGYNPTQLVTPTNWSDSLAYSRDSHELIDFAVGRDMGIGGFRGGASTVGLGLRYATFESTTHAEMDGITNMFVPVGLGLYGSHHDHYMATLSSEREFEGAGPMLSWEAALPLFGNEETGRLDLDWALTGGVLFGKQTTTIDGAAGGRYFGASYFNGFYVIPPNYLPPIVQTPIAVAPRSSSVSVPVAELSVGFAYEISRVKVGVGYRWERYFDVLDGGYDEHKDYDRTIDGPYFKLAVGFGG